MSDVLSYRPPAVTVVEDQTERAMHTALEVIDTFAEARQRAAGNLNRLRQLRERLELLVQLFHQESLQNGHAQDGVRGGVHEPQ
jgi:hypothetical protein